MKQNSKQILVVHFTGLVRPLVMCMNKQYAIISAFPHANASLCPKQVKFKGAQDGNSEVLLTAADGGALLRTLCAHALVSTCTLIRAVSRDGPS